MCSSEKEMYEAPAILVVEVAAKRVICDSEPEGQGHGFNGWN